jgi:hypothetical protein
VQPTADSAPLPAGYALAYRTIAASCDPSRLAGPGTSSARPRKWRRSPTNTASTQPPTRPEPVDANGDASADDDLGMHLRVTPPSLGIHAGARFAPQYRAVVSRQDDRTLVRRRALPNRLAAVWWVLALVGGALVVAAASQANIYRCADGWTNVGQARWFHAIAALVLTAPALGRAAWLVTDHRRTAWLRWAAVAVAVAVPVVTIALAFAFLPDPLGTGTCGD